MRGIVQRVKTATVRVHGSTVGSINTGLLVYLGFEPKDDQKDYAYICDKILNLRIFDDEHGVMNYSVTQKKYDLLLVSQFTLYGDARKGRRPSYSSGSPGDIAKIQYFDFLQKIKSQYHGCIETGKFQENMVIDSVADGPVTILLDSRKLF